MRKYVFFVVTFLAVSAILFFEKEIIFGTVLYSRAFVAGLSQSQSSAAVPDAPVFVEAPVIEITTEEPEGLPDDTTDYALVLQAALSEKQEQIDDILEKIDALKRQLADLEALLVVETPPEIENIVEIEVAKEETPPVVVAPQPAVATGGGAAYLPLLISEVQTSGEYDAKQEYVELYNPHTVEISLTDWYLQRKTKAAVDFTTFVPNTLFSGKKIAANGYFLIARKDSIFSSIADIITTHPLTDNNTLVLKNPNREPVDKVGWGLAEDKEGLPASNPPPGRSIGRSKDQQDSVNNADDFFINILSPRAENVAYVAPEESGGVLPSSVPPAPLENMVIYGVQTEGQTVSDEFVKLYNPNDVAVNLVGFSLKKKTSSGTESNLVSSGAFTGEIAAQGYFLIAPQPNDDGVENYTGSVAADLRYSGKTFSIADTNTILLYDATGLLVSEFLASPPPEVEPEPEPTPEVPAEPEISPVEPPVEPEGPPADVSPPAPQPNVVINEIAWMGAVGNVNAEWIELYNPGDNVVDLTGWILKTDEPTPIPNISLSGSIAGKSFYLLERTSDDTVPAIIANKIYTGALGNTGENLSLTDAAGNVIDQVTAIPWPAGDNRTKQTMQRVDAITWQTSEVAGGTPGL